MPKKQFRGTLEQRLRAKVKRLGEQLRQARAHHRNAVKTLEHSDGRYDWLLTQKAEVDSELSRSQAECKALQFRLSEAEALLKRNEGRLADLAVHITSAEGARDVLLQLVDGLFQQALEHK